MWITITSTALQTRLAKPELDALGTAAVQSGQTTETLVAEAIAQVTAEVRGYVAACSRNTLGETGTIPDELESAALALIRRHLFTRLPGMKRLYDEIRTKETEDALQRLRDTALCRFAIVPPATPADDADQAAGPASQLIASTTRVSSREQTAGL
jgi:hypothetical protein